MHHIVYAQLRDLYVLWKNSSFVQQKKNSNYIHYDFFALRKSYVEGNIHGSGSTERIPDRQLFLHLTQLLLRPSPFLSVHPPTFFPTFSVLTDHLGPKHRER